MPVSRRESGRTRLPPPRTSAASFASYRIVPLLFALLCILLFFITTVNAAREGASSSGRGGVLHDKNSGRGQQNTGTPSSASAAGTTASSGGLRSSAKYPRKELGVSIRGVPAAVNQQRGAEAGKQNKRGITTNSGLVSRARPGDSGAARAGANARGRVRSRAAPAPRLLNYAPRDSAANSTDMDSGFGTEDIVSDNNNNTTMNNSVVDDPGMEEEVPMNSDDQTMVVTGEITIVSGDTVMTMSGIDMLMTVTEEMSMDTDGDYIDTSGDMTGPGDDDNITDVNDIPIIMDNVNDDTTNSTDYAFDDVLDQVDSDSGVDESVDDANATISGGDVGGSGDPGNISITFDMCQNSGGGGSSRLSRPRRALVRALPALKRSSGANIVMSDACTCMVTGTDEQVRAAEEGLRKFIA